MRRRMLIAEFLTKGHGFIRQAIGVRTAANIRWNAASTAAITLTDSHPIIPRLMTEPGVRCALWMVTLDGGAVAKKRLLEGRVGDIEGRDAPFGQVTIPVTDDFDDLATMLGWQSPTSPASGQSAAEYWRLTAPSETRAKRAILLNAQRLGRPWDVAETLGRGKSAPIALRMDALAAEILPPLIDDRLQLTIARNRTTNRWDVDVREGDVFPRPITPRSGVLKTWQWTKQPATATRAVVGGRGQGTARQHLLVVDTALEAQMGAVMEIWVDAGSAPEGADLEPYGRDALAKHAAKSGLSARLQEASWFRFGETFDVGDVVALKIGALEFSDVISEVEITHDTRTGFTAVPTIGIAEGDPTRQLVKYVADVATAVHGMERK
jgi:hypothetical protein